MPYAHGEMPLLRAPTRSWNFAVDGGGPGNSTLWTVQGRVIIQYLTAFVADSLTSGGAATLEIDGVHDTAVKTDYTALTTGKWWNQGVGTAGALAVPTTNWFIQFGMATGNKTLELIVNNAAVTAGTIVFDAFYFPLDSNGAMI